MSDDEGDWAVGEENVLDHDESHSVIGHDIESLKQDLNNERKPFNPFNQTVRLTNPEPLSFNELRNTDPQRAIDYIYGRKERWKSEAIKWHAKAKELCVKHNVNYELLEKKTRESKHWKRKHKQEVEMKNWWRNAFALSAGVTAITIVAMMVVTAMSKTQTVPQFVPRVPTSGTVQNTPSRVLSSVLLYNGDNQGSGTVISKGEKYAAVLTAAHNFKGKLGGEFWLYYPDGTFTKSTLIAHDPERDLALAKVDASTIIGHSFVPNEMPSSSDFTCIGYSNGQGPNMNELSYNSTFKNSFNKFMWDITLTNGTIWDGASGGGVFLGDACIGVTSERDSLIYVPSQQGYVPTKKMYATCHQELVNFLNEQKDVLAECGDWSVEVKSYGSNEDSPPLWSPNPNVPINLPNSNVASLRKDVESLKKAVFGFQKRPNEILPEDVDGPSSPLPPSEEDVLLPTNVADDVFPVQNEMITPDENGSSTPLPEGYFETEGLKRPSDIGDLDLEEVINDYYKK